MVSSTSSTSRPGDTNGTPGDDTDDTAGGLESADALAPSPVAKTTGVAGNVYAEGGVATPSTTATNSEFSDADDTTNTCETQVAGTDSGSNTDDDGTCFFDLVADFIVTTGAQDNDDVQPGDGVCDTGGGECSLRAAVQEANALDGEQTIGYDTNQTIVLNGSVFRNDGPGGDILVTEDVIIDGRGVITIDANALGDRIFDVTNGAALTLEGLTLTGGSVAAIPADTGDRGGAVRVLDGSLTTFDVVFDDNTAAEAGGAVEFAAGTTGTFIDTDFTDNTTGQDDGGQAGNGGAIHAAGGDTLVSITGGIAAGNIANEGGAHWMRGGALDVTDADFIDNAAVGDSDLDATDDTPDPDVKGGGALFVDGDGVLVVSGGSFNGNLASGAGGSGGAILNDNSHVDIVAAQFMDNEARRAGGALELFGPIAGGVVEDSDFLSNDTTAAGLVDSATPGNGGAIHVGGGVLDVVGGSVTGNTATEGGAFWVAGGPTTVSDVTFIANIADGDNVPDEVDPTVIADIRGGGALFIQPNGQLDVIGGTFVGNQATGAGGSGGAILNDGGLLTVGRADDDTVVTTFDGNTAVRAGGAIELFTGNGDAILESYAAVYDSNVAGSSPGNGGAIHNGGGDVVVVGGSADDNRAANEGGAFWTAGDIPFVVDGVNLGLGVGPNYADEGGAFYNSGGSFDFIDVDAGEIDGAAGGLEATDPLNEDTTPTAKAGSDVRGNVYAEGMVIVGPGPASTASESTFSDGNAAAATCSDVLDGTEPPNEDDDDTCFAAPDFIVNSTGDVADADGTPDGTCDSDGGSCTLREAIQEANALPDRQTIAFDVDGPIQLTLAGAGEDGAATGDLDITDDLVILGGGDTVIDGAAPLGRALVAGLGDRLFDVLGADVSFDGLVLQGGRATSDPGDRGGAIRNDAGASVVLLSSTVQNNVAAQAGGGLENSGGSLFVEATDFLGNDGGDSTGNGGAIHAAGGTTDVLGGTVAGNVADEGGGFWVGGGGEMFVQDTVFVDNVADGDVDGLGGGALFNVDAVLELINVTVGDEGLGNSAEGGAGTEPGSGGGLLATGSTSITTITDSVFEANDANRAGGGIEAADGASVTIFDTDFIDNSATGDTSAGNGGAIHDGGANVSVTGGTVEDNDAKEGAGFWTAGPAMSVDGVTFDQNEADGASNLGNMNPADNDIRGGGALFIQPGGALVVNNSTFTGNSATGAGGSGGAILNDGGTLTVGDDADVTDVSTFTSNSSVRAGGAIEVFGLNSSALIYNADFTTNDAGSAPGNGGAIHTTNWPVTVVGGTADGNTATEGGAFWNGSSTMSVTGTTFINNVSNGVGVGDGGGALFNNGGTLDVADATIGTADEGNQALGSGGEIGDASGGGLLTNGGTTTITGTTTFTANTAVRAGGAIEATGDAIVNSTGTTFTSNSAAAVPGNGGAVHVAGSGTSTFTDVVASANTAGAKGGAFWVGGTATITLNGATATDNTAGEEGGTFYNDGGFFNFTNVIASAPNGSAPSGDVYGETIVVNGTNTSGGGNDFSSGNAVPATCNQPIGTTANGNTDDDGSCFGPAT